MTTISTTTLPLATGTWTADAAHTTVGFVVRHLGLSKVRGSFEGVTAQLVVGDSLAESSVKAEIEMGSVKTGNADRDAHLASSDFFNAETNPTMVFQSTAIAGENEEYTMVGDLTINGVTKQVDLDVEFFGTSVFPMDQPLTPNDYHQGDERTDLIRFVRSSLCHVTRPSCRTSRRADR